MAKKARKPAKRQTKASKAGLTKRKKETFLDRLPRNREEYLELLIKMTEKCINPKFPCPTMTPQLARLKKELHELRNSVDEGEPNWDTSDEISW